MLPSSQTKDNGQKSDDNAKAESFARSSPKACVDAYQKNPSEPAGRAALELFVLALAIAGWRVTGPSGLPEDPVGANWTTRRTASTGKHLMNYAVGGLGISHADNTELVAFVEKVCVFREITPAQQNQLRSTATCFREANRGAGKVPGIA